MKKILFNNISLILMATAALTMMSSITYADGPDPRDFRYFYVTRSSTSGTVSIGNNAVNQTDLGFELKQSLNKHDYQGANLTLKGTYSDYIQNAVLGIEYESLYQGCVSLGIGIGILKVGDKTTGTLDLNTYMGFYRSGENNAGIKLHGQLANNRGGEIGIAGNIKVSDHIKIKPELMYGGVASYDNDAKVSVMGKVGVSYLIK